MAATVKEHLTLLLEEQSIGRNENLTLEDLPEPSLIPGMVKASKRIIERLQNRDRMLIVGDYDCDGIMATTIMQDFFNSIGYGDIVSYIVPDRFIDGYGVSRNMVDYAIENDFQFIVTVDNGIGAKDAVAYAKENGIEVIITDHHTPGDAVPEVDIIVDLKYDQGDFPYLEISGATMAWYLCAQIVEDLDIEIDMRRWIDLVGITVVSDVMPLEDINLIFFHEAMKRIKVHSRKVYEFIFNEFKVATLTETDIGFQLVPMINAVGRIDHAKHAVNLFLSTDTTEIKTGVEYLLKINNKRKIITEQLLDLVLPEAHRQFEAGAKALIVRNENLHEGIVGILAGKLAERYRRPAFVFGWNRAKECWKGSGRTAGAVNLYNLICNGAESALGFGGHAGAVGVAIKKGEFKNWIFDIQSAADSIPEAEFYTTDSTPMEVSLGDIDNEFVDILDRFRPFGQCFQAPIFKTKVWIMVQDSYKEGLHWKCLLTDDYGNSQVAWFFHDKNIGKLNNKEIEINFTPERSYSNEGLTIQLHGTIPVPIK